MPVLACQFEMHFDLLGSESKYDSYAVDSGDRDRHPTDVNKFSKNRRKVRTPPMMELSKKVPRTIGKIPNLREDVMMENDCCVEGLVAAVCPSGHSWEEVLVGRCIFADLKHNAYTTVLLHHTEGYQLLQEYLKAKLLAHLDFPSFTFKTSVSRLMMWASPSRVNEFLTLPFRTLMIFGTRHFGGLIDFCHEWVYPNRYHPLACKFADVGEFLGRGSGRFWCLLLFCCKKANFCSRLLCCSGCQSQFQLFNRQCQQTYSTRS